MSARVFFHVNHLWGLGHFTRIAAIANACAARGLEITLASGNLALPGRLDPLVRLVALPVIRAADETYAALADVNGSPPQPGTWAARREALYAALGPRGPDLLVTETFPFGRRKLAAELLDLIAAARARNPAVRIAASIRDLPAVPDGEARIAEAAARLREHYDVVFAHGDPALIPFAAAWPGALPVPVIETGYVTPPPVLWSERSGVLVSAGGGGHGAELLQAAIAARGQGGPFAREPWTLVAGPFAPHLPAGADGIEVLAAVDDVPARLARARAAIGRGGYNTVVEAAAAGTPLVIVPQGRGGETEQADRAAAFAKAGRAVALAPGPPDPAVLAAALAQTQGLVPLALRLDGADVTARHIAAIAGGL
jgi:predicted glycosyltransferase